jgi:hypothetical protein
MRIREGTCVECERIFRVKDRGRASDKCPACRSKTAREHGAEYQAAYDRRAHYAVEMLALVADAVTEGRFAIWAEPVNWTAVGEYMRALVADLVKSGR